MLFGERRSSRGDGEDTSARLTARTPPHVSPPFRSPSPPRGGRLGVEAGTRKAKWHPLTHGWRIELEEGLKSKTSVRWLTRFNISRANCGSSQACNTAAVQLGLGRLRGELWCGSGRVWESKPFTAEDCFPVGEGDV